MKLMRILEQAANEGLITCRKCGNDIEPDADQCFCGWKNPLVELGMI